MTQHLRMPSRAGALALALFLGPSCATSGAGRAGDGDEFADVEAIAAPIPQLGAALREDPPLPGTQRSGWPALDDVAPASGDADAAAAQARGEHAHAR